MSKVQFRVTAATQGLRLDQCLAHSVPELSRRTARIALDMGAVFVDQKRVKVASRIVSTGQQVTVHLGGAFERATRKTGRAAREHDESALPPLVIVYEDADLVVVNKAAGVLSAPTPESDRNNLVSQLRTRDPHQSYFVVHRIDLQTSGILAFAKSATANRVLSETFRVHQLVRKYDVLAHGSFTPTQQTIDADVGGKAARTHFLCLKQYPKFCHLEAQLETGRTHQIRIHLQAIERPVLADPRYGFKREDWHPARLALHARSLEFTHPITGVNVQFEAPLPSDLQAFIDAHRDE